MATISSRTELTSIDDQDDVFVLDDVSASVTKKMKLGTVLKKVQDGSIVYAADSVGTDAYAVTLSPVPTAYTTGMVITFKAGVANTGACTLNVNGLGAKTIKKNHDVDLADSDIELGQMVTVAYDGTNFQMQSQKANSDVTTTGNETVGGNKSFTGNLTFSGTNTHSGAETFTGNFIAKLFAPQGFLINGKISPTVTSNNLTLAIKTLSGNDPSATDPVYCRIGDTVRAITAALSVTKNSGTNWCNAGSSELATKEIDYFVYLGYNATDGVVIGFSRFPGATQYGDFSATTTNEKYCAISTITTAASTDYYEVIGRFAATLSAGAGYTWSVPTYTALNLIQRPIYETRWLAYAVQRSGGGGGTPPTYTASDINRYQITRDRMKVHSLWDNAAGGTAGSGANNLLFSFPFSVSTNVASDDRTCVALGSSYESAGTICGIAIHPDTNPRMRVVNITSGAAILLNDQSSTVRYISFQGEVEI